MTFKTCKNCDNAFRPITPAMHIGTGVVPEIYQCRAHPPRTQPIVTVTSTGPQIIASVTVFPEMKPDDWCKLDWKPKPSTLNG